MRTATRVAVFTACMLIVSSASAQSAWNLMLTSDFIGRPVVSPQGDVLGEVEDVIFDVPNARIYTVLLAFGGWLGLGEDLHAVPPRALRPEPGTRRLVLDFEKTQPERWYPRTLGAPLDQFVPASRIVGRPVTDRTGTHAGEIEDAVMDLASGRVLFFLFDYDESWGPDKPPLRLAPQVFTFPLYEEDAAVVNISRERLSDPDA